MVTFFKPGLAFQHSGTADILLKTIKRRNSMSHIIRIPEDRDILSLFSATLAHEGYKVVQADTGQKDIRQIKMMDPQVIIIGDSHSVLMFCF
jgi:PleD family two-component response regulator